MKRIVTILLLLTSTTLFACSCIRSEFSKRDVNNAYYIVHGKVLGVEYDEKNRQNVIAFRVQKTIKGSAPKIIKIRTAASGATCGLHVKKREKWLLFIYESGGQLGVGLCDKNVRYSARRGESRASRKKNCKLMGTYLKKIKEFNNE